MAEQLPIAHKWEPIQDLPENWRDLCRPDLHAVHRQWEEDRQLIKAPAKVEAFQERLMSLWAVETGIIERLYTVDRGVTTQIVDAGMEALGQFHAQGLISSDARALIGDQREALELVMDLVGSEGQELTPFYIRSLHQRLTYSQETCEAQDQFGNPMVVPLLKGQWKRVPNNPTRPDGSLHEYCPPEQVQNEIERLLIWHKRHEGRRVCPEVEAAWLHHRLTQIHPFQDGNGRVARALAGAVLMKPGYLMLVIRSDEHRDRYLDALETADAGDLRDLVDLFADIQIFDLQQAMEFIREIRGETVAKVAELLARRAKQRQSRSQVAASNVLDYLLEIAESRLSKTVREIGESFGDEGIYAGAEIIRSTPTRYHWWAQQVVETADYYGYLVDFDQPHRWCDLSLRLRDFVQTDTRIVISLHAVSRAADLLAATGFLAMRLPSGDDSTPARWETRPIADRPFTFPVEAIEQKEDIVGPFLAWLETTIENGLAAWGERL